MKELTLQELQTESLNILKDVHAWCVENDVLYSVGYGTLIGAIRHKGFIPWDDDIDIIMPRKDYEKFCKNYKSKKYQLLCPESHNNYYLAFARVFDVNRTTTQTLVPWHDGENGVWIDVFPIDYVSDSKEKFELHKSCLQRKWSAVAWGRQAKKGFDSSLSIIKNVKLLAKKILTLNGYFTRWQLDDFIKKTACVKVEHSSHWSQLACLDGYEWHKTDDFKSTILMPFEDTEVLVMNGYDNVLRECFGDYMQLPPEENRIGHSDGYTKFYWK